MKEQTLSNTYSISKHMAQFTDRNPNHVYTAICECQHCKGKNWARINSSVIPERFKRIYFHAGRFSAGDCDKLAIESWAEYEKLENL